jgi:hypothetical protein
VLRGVVQRTTHDLDFFAPPGGSVTGAFVRLQQALVANGYSFDVIRSSPSFVRLVVNAPDRTQVLVDLGQDHRLGEPEVVPGGRTLSLVDLAADKLLAVFGRAEARDFVDVFHLARGLGIAAMQAWGRSKDPGMDDYMLATALGVMGRYPRTDFEVDDATFSAMKDFFSQLRADLLARALGDQE